MIFDRTQNDVNAAIRLIKEKVQAFEDLTANEIETLEKGTITFNTLNRIENKQVELKILLNGMGYWNTPTINNVWDENDIFNVVEFQRIVDNTNILREAFFTFTGTPRTPPVSYYWEDINALEKILYDLQEMIENVISTYKSCGSFECGEE